MGIIDYSQTINVTNQSEVDPDGLLSPYIKDGVMPTLDSIFINGKQFRGVGRDSSLGWEEFVWGEEPTRSKTFAFENMDDIDVGLVAQCEVNFKYSNIEDFMAFREAIKQRYFQVIFFNVDTCQWVQREMYCSKKERGKLHFFNPKLLGVLDLNVTLVATNRDLIPHPNVIISFNNNGYPITVSSSDSVIYGEQYELPPPPQLAGYQFSHWDTKGDGRKGGSGFQFKQSQSFTAFYNLTLYPVYKEV